MMRGILAESTISLHLTEIHARRHDQPGRSHAARTAPVEIIGAGRSSPTLLLLDLPLVVGAQFQDLLQSHLLPLNGVGGWHVDDLAAFGLLQVEETASEKVNSARAP